MARGPAPLLSQGLDERHPPPLPPFPLSEGLYPPLLCAKINATQLGSVTEPAPKSLCEEKPYEALSDMFFVPV